MNDAQQKNPSAQLKASSAQLKSNHDLSQAQKTAIGGLFLALALALPLFFHLFAAGSVMLPMFLPILTLGFLVDEKTAATVGIIAPPLSAFLTGMPPFMPPIAFMMMAELALLGAMPAVLYRRFGWKFWPSLIITILFNRVFSFALKVMLAEVFHIPGVLYGLFGLIKSSPGIALQIIVVPLVIKAIESRFPQMAPSKKPV